MQKLDNNCSRQVNQHAWLLSTLRQNVQCIFYIFGIHFCPFLVIYLFVMLYSKCRSTVYLVTWQYIEQTFCRKPIFLVSQIVYIFLFLVSDA